MTYEEETYVLDTLKELQEKIRDIPIEQLIRETHENNIMLKQIIKVINTWINYDAPLGKRDVGFTYTDPEKRTSIVGIAATSSQGELLNTIVHEAKHVQSHICDYYNVPEDGEQAAYLIGFLVQNMHKVFKYMISTGTE